MAVAAVSWDSAEAVVVAVFFVAVDAAAVGGEGLPDNNKNQLPQNLAKKLWWQKNVSHIKFHLTFATISTSSAIYRVELLPLEVLAKVFVVEASTKDISEGGKRSLQGIGDRLLPGLRDCPNSSIRTMAFRLRKRIKTRIETNLFKRSRLAFLILTRSISHVLKAVKELAY